MAEKRFHKTDKKEIETLLKKEKLKIATEHAAPIPG